MGISSLHPRSSPSTPTSPGLQRRHDSTVRLREPSQGSLHVLSGGAGTSRHATFSLLSCGIAPRGILERRRTSPPAHNLLLHTYFKLLLNPYGDRFPSSLPYFPVFCQVHFSADRGSYTSAGLRGPPLHLRGPRDFVPIRLRGPTLLIAPLLSSLLSTSLLRGPQPLHLRGPPARTGDPLGGLFLLLGAMSENIFLRGPRENK